MISPLFAPLFARLRPYQEVDALLEAAAHAAPEACRAADGLIALVDDGRVAGPISTSSAMPDALADAVRAAEVEVPRGGSGGRQGRVVVPHGLLVALGDEHAAAAWVASREDPLALLVVWGADPPVERSTVEDVAQTIAIALERVVLARRAHTFADEVGRFARSVRSAPKELVDTVITLADDQLDGPRASARTVTAALLRDLSPGERRVAELMVEGQSNTQIGHVLQVSPETVKTQVARIRRKLGARNRVEAIALLLGDP